MTNTPNNEPAARDPGQWLALDAGRLREVLAAEMADWLAAGFVSSYRAERFDRFARRLAALAEMSVDDIYCTLRAEGLAILSACRTEPHPIFRR